MTLNPASAAASRQAQLLNWLSPWLQQSSPDLKPVAGDASFRCYYRLPAAATTFKQSLIVMDAPPEKESSTAFLHLAQTWKQAGLAVPQIFAASATEGFALLEDFGDQTLMQAVKNQPPEQADPLYCQALEQLYQLQQVDGSSLPPYDAALLAREIDLFDDWLLDALLQIKERPRGWQALRGQLIEQALAQPQVPVHRDYHSRNLMVQAAAPLGILDFQDAVYGPCTYDLVSLLRDCYLDWPETWQTQWREAFRAQAYAHISAATFTRWFDQMGMQRHLKAAGIFARLWLRDGKAGYLADLPLTLRHLSQALKKDADWADIGDWIHLSVEPAVAALTLSK